MKRGPIIASLALIVAWLIAAQASVIVVAPAEDLSAEADWTARSTASGVIVAENFSSYADRGEWFTKLAADAGDGGGVHYAYTGVAFDGGPDGNYADPIPEGTDEKLGLDSSVFLTGGKSARHRLYNSEGATEAGPVWELALPSAQAEVYLQFSIYVDSDLIGHDFGGNDTKMAFLNHLSFTSGQVVSTFINSSNHQIPKIYRVNSSASWVYNLLSSPPLPSGGSPGFDGDHALYPLLDKNPAAGTSYADHSAWEQRHGFRRRNSDLNDADYSAIYRMTGGEWHTYTYYLNFNHVGSVSDGMLKMWGGKRGDEPELLIGALNNADLRVEGVPKSFRFIIRPEDATIASPAGADGHGFRFDEIIISTSPIEHPGGFALPFPGTEVPTGYPYSGTAEES